MLARRENKKGIINIVRENLFGNSFVLSPLLRLTTPAPLEIDNCRLIIVNY